MDKTFVISVKSKRAKNLSKIKYVCGNTDYRVAFDLDEDWEGIEAKTARFQASDGTVSNTPFVGSTCPFPQIMDAYRVDVGIFAGNLKTSTNAVVECERSALSTDGPPPDPLPDVYAKIMEMLNQLLASGSFGAENAGRLVVIGEDGKLIPITLGSEFEIVEGVLRIKGQITPPDEPDVPDEPDEPEPPVEVVLTVDQDGNATLDGAVVTVAADGAAVLENAVLTVDENGNGIIE